ncbi:lipid droplet-associated hydrolase [Pistacia vera]|uniref:lipid droplet-associated hydrolase n=1 Tax=Pistacia vera TaxID=55513 RepID=UPI001262B936|nr:lipid droplet-associated hydrolase [Pistacia vera]
MLLHLLSSIPTLFTPSLSFHLIKWRTNCANRQMGRESLLPQVKKPLNFRLCKVSGHTSEVLEIQADDPTLHVLFIPGNPGVISFYKDFLESLYELLGGRASITVIGHISQTAKDWEHGRLFSLQEQIDHKMDFIGQELQNTEVPIILVGHSIGSYISVEVLKRSLEKVIYCVGLYPFLALNRQSIKQSIIGKIAASSFISAAVSFAIASLGLLPRRALTVVVSKSFGSSWSGTAVEVACTHLSQYHVMRNVLFLAMTEFKKLSETPDWAFMRANQDKIAFLFGIDDQWGPLQMFEEISKQAPDIGLSIEREGHTHAFCCTQAGSSWAAGHVANLIRKRFQVKVRPTPYICRSH